jgi:hypothetical protein
MKFAVKITLLIGSILPVIAAYCYIYEASSQVDLPVINYPLRSYAIPLLVVGALFLLTAGVLHKASREPT